jgi:hypothetical protein
MKAIKVLTLLDDEDRAALAKFDQDEKRDESGKWTSGGGGGKLAQNAVKPKEGGNLVDQKKDAARSKHIVGTDPLVGIGKPKNSRGGAGPEEIKPFGTPGTKDMVHTDETGRKSITEHTEKGEHLLHMTDVKGNTTTTKHPTAKAAWLAQNSFHGGKVGKPSATTDKEREAKNMSEGRLSNSIVADHDSPDYKEPDWDSIDNSVDRGGDYHAPKNEVSAKPETKSSMGKTPEEIGLKGTLKPQSKEANDRLAVAGHMANVEGRQRKEAHAAELKTGREQFKNDSEQKHYASAVDSVRDNLLQHMHLTDEDVENAYDMPDEDTDGSETEALRNEVDKIFSSKGKLDSKSHFERASKKLIANAENWDVEPDKMAEFINQARKTAQDNVREEKNKKMGKPEGTGKRAEKVLNPMEQLIKDKWDID